MLSTSSRRPNKQDKCGPQCHTGTARLGWPGQPDSTALLCGQHTVRHILIKPAAHTGNCCVLIPLGRAVLWTRSLQSSSSLEDLRTMAHRPRQ